MGNTARIALNNAIRDNYAFYCPTTGVHLNIHKPVTTIKTLSPSILRGIIGGTLLDLDKVIDVDNKVILDKSNVQKVVKEKVADTQKVSAPIETKDAINEVVQENKDEVVGEANEEKATTAKKSTKKKVTE